MKKSKMAAKMASDLKYILCLSRFATCPQSYNLFFYTMSATSFGFQYRHCDFVKKRHIVMWAIFESLPYRSAPIFQICFMVLLQYVLSDFTRFVDPRRHRCRQ